MAFSMSPESGDDRDIPYSFIMRAIGDASREELGEAWKRLQTLTSVPVDPNDLANSDYSLTDRMLGALTIAVYFEACWRAEAIAHAENEMRSES